MRLSTNQLIKEVIRLRKLNSKELELVESATHLINQVAELAGVTLDDWYGDAAIIICEEAKRFTAEGRDELEFESDVYIKLLAAAKTFKEYCNK